MLQTRTEREASPGAVMYWGNSYTKGYKLGSMGVSTGGREEQRGKNGNRHNPSNKTGDSDLVECVCVCVSSSLLVHVQAFNSPGLALCRAWGDPSNGKVICFTNRVESRREF